VLSLRHTAIDPRLGVMDCGVVDESIEPAAPLEDAFDQRAPSPGIALIGEDLDASGHVGGHYAPIAKQRRFGSAPSASSHSHYGHRAHRSFALAWRRTSGSICRIAVSLPGANGCAMLVLIAFEETSGGLAEESLARACSSQVMTGIGS
jgi:hypothetical protein